MDDLLPYIIHAFYEFVIPTLKYTHRDRHEAIPCGASTIAATAAAKKSNIPL